jgi:hypothetical protein
VSRCISQQVDLLGVLGQLAFSLPELEDAAYEAKATSAVEALLKDMEVAQVSQPGGGCTASWAATRWCQQHAVLPDASGACSCQQAEASCSSGVAGCVA